MRRRPLLLLCLGLGGLFCALSQRQTAPEKPHIFYYEADSLYRRALWLGQQPLYNEVEEERLNRASLQRFQRYFAAVDRSGQPTDSLYFFASLHSGELTHYFDSLSLALQHYNRALGLRAQLPAVADSLFFKPYVLAGLIYIVQNKLDSALASLKSAEALQDAHPRPLAEAERLYNLLGGMAYEYGNYHQAKNYFGKAADALSKANPSYEALYVTYRVNLATSLFKLEEYHAADSIYRNLLKRGAYLQNQINNNLGLIQLSLGAPRQAIAYFTKLSYQSEMAVGLNNDLAAAYLRLHLQDSARFYLRQAAADQTQYANGKLSLDYGRTLKLSGDLERQLGHFDSALMFYQQALRHFYPAFTDTAMDKNPAVFSGAFSYLNLFQTLVAKAETQEALYAKTGILLWATQSLETYAAAFRLIEYVEQMYESDDARLFLTRIKQAIHSRPIDLAFNLYKKTGKDEYLDALYSFDQQNKATVLALNRRLNAGSASSPKTSEERRLKMEITRLSIKAAQLKDGVQTDTLGRQIRELEIALAKTQKKNHGQPRAPENFPSLTKLRTQFLDKETALLSYHFSPGKLTTLVVTKSYVNCFQDSLAANFSEQLLRQIRQSKDRKKFSPALSDLSQARLFLRRLPEGRLSQLIIVPDDILAYFPFESLRDSAGRFLVQRLAVQYQFSTALLEKNQWNFSTARTLAFAPFAGTTHGGVFPALPASAQEIAQTNGQKLLDAAATKDAFLRYSGNYAIVHLATHAVANNNLAQLSHIVFAPGKNSQDNLLYAGEIYNLRLPKTNLVILSACETGAGNLVKGEGVLSLSRAFAYAGCANVITSLWKADDFSTAYLVARVQHYLKNGFSIALSLQKAKQDYLADNTINPRLKHPYYWAHLVFVGNYSPQADRKEGWWVFAFIATVVGAAVLIYRRQQKIRS